MGLSNQSIEVAIAANLLGQPPDAVLPVASAGNNRLFRVFTAQRAYALKLYGGEPDVAAIGLQRETAAFRFLTSGPLADCVPALVAVDGRSRAVLFEWVTGEMPVPRRTDEVKQLQRLVTGLLTVSRGPVAAAFPPATGACAKPADLARQIEASRDHLRSHQDIGQFGRILGLFDAFWPSVRSGLLLPQDPARLVLSPVDFGFHKALRRYDGQLIFFNFEHFGWDDPARMVANLLWNPAMSLEPSEAARLAVTAHNVFGEGDGGFSHRFTRFWPAIGLSWALRLLEKARAARHPLVARSSQDNANGRRFDTAEICIRRVEERLHEMAA